MSHEHSGLPPDIQAHHIRGRSVRHGAFSVRLLLTSRRGLGIFNRLPRRQLPSLRTFHQHVQHVEMVHGLYAAGVHVEIHVAHHHRGVSVHPHLQILEVDRLGDGVSLQTLDQCRFVLVEIVGVSVNQVVAQHLLQRGIVFLDDGLSVDGHRRHDFFFSLGVGRGGQQNSGGRQERNPLHHRYQLTRVCWSLCLFPLPNSNSWRATTPPPYRTSSNSSKSARGAPG